MSLPMNVHQDGLALTTPRLPGAMSVRCEAEPQSLLPCRVPFVLDHGGTRCSVMLCKAAQNECRRTQPSKCFLHVVSFLPQWLRDALGCSATKRFQLGGPLLEDRAGDENQKETGEEKGAEQSLPGGGGQTVGTAWGRLWPPRTEGLFPAPPLCGEHPGALEPPSKHQPCYF